ncbi:putative O-glycosylation ligase, exosortase A system-associated [Sphingomonas montanisoli]|uniref:Putative O-glycosylation ligase, exosortase A system-associated n=1 Tax=Sphingomonas montanisoli TaxID=2606412 RepID=A0A5D9CAP3_9SPHN|nr:putative O-glycosylation ligase, exosortase A system-associated [Sphingomonas montanisoli]TZG28864.1 putative O-glycosylation ligase, exosortase A system-associated [Sphingomonas montanisoli]
MRDIFLIVFMLGLIVLAMRRPFLFVCGYIYIDIVSPQRLAFYLLSSIPISLIFFIAAFVGWAINDNKKELVFSARQIMLIILLLWCAITTWNAVFFTQAMIKWDWVWKALVFAIFLPMTLYTRQRIETVLIFMIISLSAITVVGGLKTLAGGGGYGTLNLMVSNNSGLYEGSIISAVAICMIPLILWYSKYGTIFPPNLLTRLYCYALVFANLLIPIGTQARTGLVCIAFMILLELRAAKHRMRYIAIVAAAAIIAIPLMPSSFNSRMETIAGYHGDASASTRIAVWKWTLDYVKEHPFGGGFDVYLANKLTINMSYRTADGTTVNVQGYDQGRAFHNSYFEMLGEQGYFGIVLFLLIHLTGIIRMEFIRRTYRKSVGDDEWVSPLAASLQHAHLIYLLGASFVGIALQPFIYLIVAVEIGFDVYVQRHIRRRAWNPFRVRKSRQSPDGQYPPVPDEEEDDFDEPEPERSAAGPRWGRKAVPKPAGRPS